MKCPHCGIGTLVRDTRDVSFKAHGETVVLPQVTGEFCTACGECVLGPEESRRMMELIQSVNRQGKATSLP